MKTSRIQLCVNESGGRKKCYMLYNIVVCNETNLEKTKKRASVSIILFFASLLGKVMAIICYFAI